MATLTAHIPVLLKESIEALAVRPGGRYVDCTVGAGGHAEAILRRSEPGGQLLGFDADPVAVELTQERLKTFGAASLIVNENFSNLSRVCAENAFTPLNGILFDLGMSSMQLGESGHGFSFQHDAPLDMRFSPDQKLSASDIVNDFSEAELARMLYEYGEESNSRQIASAIVRSRPIYTTEQLAVLVESVVPRHGRIHPATKTFQALRIAVNAELENLEKALLQAIQLLGHEGRLVVISYHSLEDRIVKNFMRREATECICPPGLPQCVCCHKSQLRLVSRHAIVPSLAEEKANPRSRSARLRVAERILSGKKSARAKRPTGFGKLFGTSLNMN